MNPSKNKALYRNLVQVLFLLIFSFLAFKGSIQLWIIVFGFGLLISLIWGRFYCGWICPINTVLRIKNWVYKKLNINVFNTPNYIKKQWIRWVILLLFIGIMVISRRINLQINMILYVLILAFVISLIFDEEIWHKYLCPYGVLLELTDKANNKKLVIDEKLCKTCGICIENCPNNIIFEADNIYNIQSKECLKCFKCQDLCKFNAINYK